MFRPLTMVAITAFSLVGWHVYQAEDAAQQLEREHRDVMRRIESARERTLVLRAEWAMLNEPDRLRQVAQSHLPLSNMTPQQFLRMGDLEKRLPAPVAFAGPISLFGNPPDTAIAELGPEAAPAAEAVPVAVAAPRPSIRPAAVEHQPSAEPAPRPVSRPTTSPAEPPRAVATRIEPKPEPRRAVAVAEPAPVRSVPAPQPIPRGPVLAETQSRGDGGLMRTASAALPMGRAMAAPVPAPAPAYGSSLGYAGGGMAPPVPMGRPVPVSGWSR
ncbi:hypothetical protein ACFOD4_14995 [Pseudoroseomonas globiformis]|uniref:Cell division protein FtsL n=1 Tax=Teichococcus globiformis TaxID=2307229 RepID=A0ABV7G5B4_9PROT